jgi:hypothetical protein
MIFAASSAETGSWNPFALGDAVEMGKMSSTPTSFSGVDIDALPDFRLLPFSRDLESIL